jgi:hypothetical protein
MINTFPSPQYVAVPYNVIMKGQTQPMLGNNPKDFENSRKKGSYYFFLIASRLSSVLGIIAVVMSIVWVSTIMFDDKSIRNVYQTTSFTTTLDRANADSWQILTQSWSEVSKTNPSVDVQFDHYFECWHAAGVKNDVCTNTTVADYKQCILSKYTTQLDTCVNSSNPNAITPSFNEYTKCVNNYLLPTTQSLRALEICLRTNAWPMFESPQPVDSWYFLASFNWAVLLTIGFALYSCFVLYTGGFVFNAEHLELREPGMVAKNGPLSQSITVACALFSLVFFLYFLVNAYRLPNSNIMGSKYPFPNSIATNTIMIPATLIVFVYFVIELLEMWNPPNILKKMGFTGDKMLQAGNMPHRAGHYKNPGGQDYSADLDKSWAETITHYFPALTLTWADGYMIDPIIAIGLIGTSHQCTTSILYQIFMALFTYRMAHTSVARFMYEGYIYNPDEKEGKFNRQNADAKNELYAVRMQAMFMHLSAVAALVMFWNIISNPNYMLIEFPLISTMLYFWYVIPEVIRLIAHIIVAFQAIGMPDKYVLLSTNYFIWIWDVSVRFVYICIILWGASNITGTQYFLDARLQNITGTILYMTA